MSTGPRPDESDLWAVVVLLSGVLSGVIVAAVVNVYHLFT